jgi:hypothetical protein
MQKKPLNSYFLLHSRPPPPCSLLCGRRHPTTYGRHATMCRSAPSNPPLPPPWPPLLLSPSQLWDRTSPPLLLPLPCSRAAADHLHLAKGGPDGCLVPFIEEEGAKEAEDVWVRAIGRWWPATWWIWLSAVMTEPRVQDGLHRRRPWR